MSEALKTAIEAAKTELRELATAGETAPWTDEQRSRVADLKAEVKDLEERSALHAEFGAPAPAAPAVPAPTGSEGRSIDAAALAPAGPTPAAPSVEARSPYADANTPHSWFHDQAVLANRDASNAQVEEARGRLTAHYESANDESGARAIRTYSTTTASQGGYLAAPTYLQSAFAELLAAGRPTADLVGKIPMPATGTSVFIPTQTGATAVAAHTENAALTATDATVGQIQLDIIRGGGKATMPNFLVDRSFPGADQLVLADLAVRYGLFVDDVVLNSSTSNRKGLLQETGLGGATATATTPTIATLWPALLNAVEDVASGVYMYPDAIVMHPRRWSWFAGQLDSSNRPVIGSVNPQNAVAAYGGMNGGAGAVPVGNILGIPVYLDASIPTNFGASTNEDRIIVMKRDEPKLLETAPKFGVSMEAAYGNDQMVARVTGDVAFTCARRKAAVSIISGTALAATI